MATSLGDPIGLRPSIRRGWDGRLGEHLLSDGNRVWVVWLPVSSTHVHIVIFDDEIVATEENVVRAGAARRTEQMLQELD